MKGSLKGFAGNILFALNIFIIFLLLFESRLVIPYWLQPVGRMHPMLLHFPIAILMLAMALEFFRFRAAYRTQEFYQGFTENLLIVGAVSSAITVIMGLFLSKEGGYTGSTLQWHKWSGIGIVFIASVIYWSRNAKWYKVQAARAGAVIMSFCLIIAGHYGASLTHGDNFILEPISANAASVPVDQAIVFDHVIKPIFDKKCLSCHNPDKIKGSLLLTDAESILKGGKTGKLFVGGKPELSLLLQRIHLPLEDKKHMPPSGKVQLTEEEISLLYFWVKSNPDFKKKVIELPENDSLRILATAVLKPAESSEEVFDFAAADEETIKELNNNYRVVAPLARSSPALAVNLYNRSAYNPKALEELEAVKTQIVSLDLNKMPVKDADLKIISRFKNLQKLNLNFTDITGKGLGDLKSLTHLKSLSLSGTKVNYQALQQLREFKSLDKVTVWSTGLKEAEIRQLQKANRHIQFIAGFKDDGAPIKLNLPQLKNNGTVFSTALIPDLKHPISGVKLRYTTDGSDPDSLHSPEFKNGGIIIKENTTLKVKAYKSGWISSDITAYTFFKSRYKPETITFLTEPNERYKGEGANGLINGRSGNFAFRSEEWVGFLENDMQAVMEFKQPVTLSSVALNVMVNPGGFIYPPGTIEIWGGLNKDGLQLLNSVKPVRISKSDTTKKAVLSSITCSFKATPVTHLKVIATRQKLPAGYIPAKDKPAPNVLLFINELLFN